LLDRSGEVRAVVDEFADEAEDAAEAAGHVRGRPRWIGGCGRRGGSDRGRHERNKNTNEAPLSRKIFLPG
jgi:hypothetical protein